MSALSRRNSNSKVFLAYKCVKKIDEVCRQFLNWACGTLGNELVSPVWQKLNMQMPSQKKNLKLESKKNFDPQKLFRNLIFKLELAWDSRISTIISFLLCLKGVNFMITAILKVTLHYGQTCQILSKDYDIFFALWDVSMIFLAYNWCNGIRFYIFKKQKGHKIFGRY